MMNKKHLKKEIFSILHYSSLADLFSFIAPLPAKQVVNIFFSGLSHGNEKIKWHSVKGMGQAMLKLAEEDINEARMIIRRLLWSLMEESGSIGWGAPEAIAEIMSCQARLREDYFSIFISFMDEEGNYLEFDPLKRGVAWGVGRLAEKYSDLLFQHQAHLYLPQYLETNDQPLLGYACYAALKLKMNEAVANLEKLVGKKEKVMLFLESRFIEKEIGDLAKEALKAIYKD
jgi:hypothetical protein